MPTLEKALTNDLSGYTPVDKPMANAPTPSTNLQPGRSTMIRCPLPILGAATPDALRSYYRSGQVPQFRLLTPQSAASGGAASSTASAVTASSSGGETTASIVSATASITTATIGPNQNFTGVLATSKSFQLLSIALSSPARVRMYGTAVAQAGDLSRGLDVPPAAGTAQNIICDVVLDTAPYQWSFQSRVGANSDATQTGATYVTITNLDTTSDAITLTFLYVPLET